MNIAVAAPAPLVAQSVAYGGGASLATPPWSMLFLQPLTLPLPLLLPLHLLLLLLLLLLLVLVLVLEQQLLLQALMSHPPILAL